MTGTALPKAKETNKKNPKTYQEWAWYCLRFWVNMDNITAQTKISPAFWIVLTEGTFT